MTKIIVQSNTSYEDAIAQTIDCKVCGAKDEKPTLRREYRFGGSHWYLDEDSERRRSVGVCSTCDFWLDKWRMRNDAQVARINGQHYMFGNYLQDAIITPETTLQKLAESLPQRSGFGMGGRGVVIRFADGRVVITNDLWHQGKIPARFKNIMHDNAEMVVSK